MITIPSLKPELFRSLEVDFGTSVAMGIWQRLARQLNWMNAAMPIGMIMYFYDSTQFAGGPNVPDPSSNNWQFCNGSLISNPNSPLLGQSVPDLRDLFLKGSALAVGSTGGATTHDLTHNHGGLTTETCDTTNETLTDFALDKAMGNCHKHSIGFDLGIITVMPQYIELQPYMRIA